MFFVNTNSDLYSTSATAVMYTISCYIWPRYIGTQLFMLSGHFTFLAHGMMKCWEMKKKNMNMFFQSNATLKDNITVAMCMYAYSCAAVENMQSVNNSGLVIYPVSKLRQLMPWCRLDTRDFLGISIPDAPRLFVFFFHESRFAFLPHQIHYSDVTWAS